MELNYKGKEYEIMCDKSFDINIIFEVGYVEIITEENSDGFIRKPITKEEYDNVCENDSGDRCVLIDYKYINYLYGIANDEEDEKIVLSYVKEYIDDYEKEHSTPTPGTPLATLVAKYKKAISELEHTSKIWGEDSKQTKWRMENLDYYANEILDYLVNEWKGGKE